MDFIMSNEVDQFNENMKSYGLGKALENLAEKQLKVVEAVHDTGLQGTLTLVLKFKRAGQSGIAVSADVKHTVPQRPMQTVEMFMDENHNLHEENPDQLTFGENVHQIDEKKDVHQA